MAEELIFPQVCHVKIIAEADEGSIRTAIELVFEISEKLTVLTEGNRSEGGKYVTYNITVRVYSKAEMDAFDVSLRMIPGVRFVL